MNLYGCSYPENKTSESLYGFSHPENKIFENNNPCSLDTNNTEGLYTPLQKGYSSSEIKKHEGEEKMSNIIVYNEGEYALIASDSRNMRGNTVFSDEYQKIFPFKDKKIIVAAYGVTTFVGENSYREEVGEIIKKCMKYDNYVEEIVSELSYRNLGEGTGLIFAYFVNKGVQIKYVQISPQKTTIEILSKLNCAYTFGTYYIPNINPETVYTVDGIKKMVKTNALMDSFVHNPPVINDTIQVFKISREHGIENFSDAPFN